MNIEALAPACPPAPLCYCFTPRTCTLTVPPCSSGLQGRAGGARAGVDPVLHLLLLPLPLHLQHPGGECYAAAAPCACLCSPLLLAAASAAAAAVAAAGRLKTRPVLLPPCPSQVAAVDEPKLHMWETGIMRITRHPQVCGTCCFVVAAQLSAGWWV